MPGLSGDSVLILQLRVIRRAGDAHPDLERGRVAGWTCGPRACHPAVLALMIARLSFSLSWSTTRFFRLLFVERAVERSLLISCFAR